MDKAKLIDAMAIADYEDGNHYKELWGQLPKKEQDVYRDAAKRMLKTLCKELPEVNHEKGQNDIEHQQICAKIEKGLQQNQSLAHIATNIQKADSMVNYYQLKLWGVTGHDT